MNVSNMTNEQILKYVNYQSQDFYLDLSEQDQFTFEGIDLQNLEHEDFGANINKFYKI